jgi:pimeloyl-ACP methyl ester carboxylesterase
MDRSISIQGVNIMYRVIGDGNPVLLIHGFGEDSQVWDQQVEALKDHFRLIIPDLPGSGRSDMIPDMSMEGMAEVLRMVITKESTTGPVSVIAHSMGGYIALALLENYPHLLNSLCLFHSTSYADTAEKKETRNKGISFIQTHGPFEFLKTSIPNLFAPLTKEKRPALVEDFIAQQHSFSAEALVSYYKAMIARPDRTVLLRNSRLPLLFIMGKYDNAVPFTDSLQQCHLPEKSYIHILRNSGHMGMLEETEKVNSILTNFLMEAPNSN